MANMMAITTEQILFSGTVQGVGFRWTAERMARDLAVTGFVRNLADGRVEIIATGETVSISQLISRLADRFGLGIAGVERIPRSVVEEFSGFAIRR